MTIQQADPDDAIRKLTGLNRTAALRRLRNQNRRTQVR